MGTTFQAKQYFDDKRMRQYINDELSVFHCHHYATLFSQLADDAKLLNGPKHLADATEESMYPVLVKYFKDNNITDRDERVSIAEQHFGFIGLGELKITSISDIGGSATMLHSHVDEGWIKKWSQRDKPINYMGRGYLSAAFSAIMNSGVGNYIVQETQSIVCGAEKSEFTIRRK